MSVRSSIACSNRSSVTVPASHRRRLIDADEADHEVCRLVLVGLQLPLLTTWPTFTEAMYLLSRAGGAPGRDALWKLTLSGRLDLADLSRSALERSSRLIAKYADLPMDLADATRVALVEDCRPPRAAKCTLFPCREGALGASRQRTALQGSEPPVRALSTWAPAEGAHLGARTFTPRPLSLVMSRGAGAGIFVSGRRGRRRHGG